MMHRLALVFVVAGLTTCGHGSAQPGTGIRGVVSLGPQCPVESLDSPCPDLPFRGDVVATAADGSTTSVATDAEGRFSMDMAAGTYTVSAVTSGGGPPTAVPQTVVVHDGGYTRVTLEVDTGIR